MDIEGKNQEVFQFYNCQQHPDQAMNRICIDDNCDQCTFVCPLCIEKYHPGHRTEPVKTVMRRLREQRTLVNSETSFEEFKQQIAKQKQNSIQQITRSKEHIDRMLEDLKVKVTLHFDKLTQGIQIEHQVYMRVSLSSSKEFKYNDKWKRKDLVSDFRTIFKAFRQNQTSLDKLQKHIQVRLNHVRVNMEELLGKLVSQNQSLFEKIASTIGVGHQQTEIFDWSPDDRHSDVNIRGKIAERMQVWKNASACAMMNKTVNIMPPATHEWVVKIVKLCGFIDIGICLESKIKKNGYLLSSQKEVIGHGNYMIRSRGQVINSENKTLNSLGKCFEFNAGDIITVKYDVSYGSITFNKNGDQERYSMDVASPIGDHFRPCVYLWKIGDTVEIIDKNR